MVSLIKVIIVLTALTSFGWSCANPEAPTYQRSHLRVPAADYTGSDAVDSLDTSESRKNPSQNQATEAESDKESNPVAPPSTVVVDLPSPSIPGTVTDQPNNQGLQNATLTGVISCSTLDWTKVTTAEDLACLGSVEKVFETLPDFFKKNYSLMIASNSPQKASQAFPRVIVISPSTNFVVAAATDPSSPKEVEIGIFDQKAEIWRYTSLEFISANTVKIERKICAACHGQDPHTIWATYPAWTNAIGAERIPDGRGLTQVSADFMNRAAARSAETPTIIRGLKLSGGYKAGSITFTDTGNGAYENNQALNFVIDYKNARVLARKIMDDPKVTKQQKLNIFKTTLCGDQQGNDINAFRDAGYKGEDFMFHGVLGQDLEGFPKSNYWNGGEVEGLYVGAEIFRRYLLEDKDLQAKLPEAIALFNDNRYKFMIAGSESESQQLMNDNKFYIQTPSFYVGGVVRPFFKSGSKACEIIKGLN